MALTTESTPSQRLDPATRLRFLRQMLTIRAFEFRVGEFYERAEMPGITHLSIGQEAVAVGVCAHLDHNDYITSTHRGHGHCYAKGAGLVPMFGELLGKANGYCRGKGGSMHIADRETGHLGANAIIGGGIPLATGAALSAKVLRNRGVGVSFFGDGALNEGILLESMNLAAIWNLPAIFACENNHYGEYTPTEQVTAGRLTLRGEAFGIPSAEVDGMDVLAVYDATHAAVQRARNGEGPSFFVFDTYRYLGHGMSDRTRPYRSREEEDLWRTRRDPIERLRKQLLEAGHTSESELDAMAEAVNAEVEEAARSAQEAPFPDPEEVDRHVFAD
ncbi:MAG: thiamine pyrophosphate-dependent dehydrogenase E1 component subunit alpha [Candidatus Aminicenantes bacterium]|nr:thiamine pyrophosphate-dependent dehydrogenase E1 component subunit alpha [Candidatus Aminicenantes bacterium]